ncbi:MAG TPA: hypothetical protein VFI42_15820 [Thermomicrobiaceae bacterium]|nr:hypothetical protein [Thermomicrobiaceae bacterium]
MGLVSLQRVARTGLGLAFAISLFAGAAGASAGDAAGGKLFAGSTPRTDGTTVVYETMASGDWSVAGTRLADRQQFPLSPGGSGAMYADVEGDVAVWQENRAHGDFDIVGKRFDSNTPFTIADSARNEVYPALSDGWVAFVSMPHIFAETETPELQVRSVVTLDEAITLDRAPFTGGPSSGFLRPAISGKRVAWVRLEQTGPHLVHWQLKTQRLGEAAATVVAEADLDIGGPLGALATPSVDLSGDILVYSADLRLTVVNLASGERHEIASAQEAGYHPAQNPTTDGRYVFWQDYHGAGDTGTLIDMLQRGTLTADIGGYDLLTGSRFAAVAGQGYNADPYARNGLLTFARKETVGQGESQVYALPVASLLPSAAQGDPRDPDVSYFPETGHWLGGEIRDFWKLSGGLPVFGYPLTAEFDEGGFTAQYFERQRFELHPEHAGTPYAVELGLLGVEDAAKRGLLDTAAFQRLAEDAPRTAPCQYFAATGHTLCATFLNFWQTHGLEFGDPGVSARESLALFGYPISEPFTDPDTGLTVQYFERARFEWHPENSAPYNLLLGRLGFDRLSERGW